MARAILLAAATAWAVSALGAIVLAAAGTEALERALPPLAIDTEALRGAIVAVAVALAVVAAAHALVVVGMRQGRRLAWTAGILLGAVMAAASVALAAAAFTSAIATPAAAAELVAGGVIAVLGAVAYGVVTVRLVREQASKWGS